MALRYINSRIKTRRDTIKNLTDNNPLLYDGELCFESDTLKFKLGNGIDKYVDLPYAGGISIPTGTILPFAGKSLPGDKGDFLLCNGQAVSRDTYADLYKVIGTTYGSGNGNSTFNVPNLTNRFVEGGTFDNVGKTYSAGLPDITGSIFDDVQTTGHGDYGDPKNTPTGAFWRSRYIGTVGYQHGGSGYMFDFAASKSNSIYGSSNTVQPPALVVPYIIKT